MKPKICTLAVCGALSLAYAHAASNYQLQPGDPLVKEQWYLKNTGQTAFSARGGKAGNDLNLAFTHLRGIRGVGITVAVIDDGLEIAHPDLAANVKPGSKNFVTGTDDPTPSGNNGHGTAVAGVAAAVGWNNIGGRGVAPSAGLKGYNYLLNQSQDAFLHSHGKLPNDAPLVSNTDSRVFNQSYGSSLTGGVNADTSVNLSLRLQEQTYEEVTRFSHWGRGSLFVKSAGNGYNNITVGLTDGNTGYVFNDRAMPLQDANLEPANNNYWNMVIAALNADGVRSSYSTPGASVLLTGTGGEYGTDSPAMVTTDLTGCKRGFNVTGATSNSLQGGTALDPNCNFTGQMNGTSAAAPSVSGAVALVMSTNPALNWRDVRHILISTARKVDADNAGVSLDVLGKDGSKTPYVAIPGWQKNAAGYNFHNFYGFGLVDVDRAVEAALFYSNPLPAQIWTDWNKVSSNARIPDGKLDGASSTFELADNMTIEAVQVRVNVAHTRPRDLAFELISPSGTRSVILSPNNSLLTTRALAEQRMLSNHFYGESGKGKWTLRVIDTSAAVGGYYLYNAGSGAWSAARINNNATDGTLQSWSIRFIGHKKS
ncbi:S8 family serine peptidase [Burkholderiaceae bacterium DAT-1]|nr:S8 family serine peptidase [Burkholderiaceae bacterium DAT-1]